MTQTPEYQIYALRYATLPTRRRPENFIGGDPHDGPMPMDYYMWLIRSESEAILVDTGFDAEGGTARGRTVLETPASLLGGFGLTVGDIKDIIVTHFHYDHAGNRDVFPSALYHVQDAEMAYATGRSMGHASVRHPFDVRDVTAMVARVFADQVRFHDGVSEFRPGITLHHIGGHTAGLQVVRVWTRRGWMVLASDASHYYANMEEGRGFPIVHNLPDMLEGHRICYALADGDANVIPGHDPLVMARYPAVPGMEGRAVRVDLGPV